MAWPHQGNQPTPLSTDTTLNPGNLSKTPDEHTRDMNSTDGANACAT